MDFQQQLEASYENVRAASAGYLALEAIGGCQQATVLGATSRGLFLRSNSRWLIFLSYEQYRSPLTITLQTPGQRLRSVEPQSVVRVQPDALTFPTARLRVRVAWETVWRPAPPSGQRDHLAGQVARLYTAADAALAAGRDRGLGPLLRPLLGSPAERALSPEQQHLLDSVLQYQQAVSSNDVVRAGDAASRLLGLGRGLTASGDDFLVGFLLLLNRHAAGGLGPNRLQRLNRVITAAAYEKTTTLSANLIECAARGESDERLAAMADCLALGRPAIEDCIEPLLDWGASSGVDALVGMAAALLLDD